MTVRLTPTSAVARAVVPFAIASLVGAALVGPAPTAAAAPPPTAVGSAGTEVTSRESPWVGTWSAAANGGVTDSGYAGFTIRNSLRLSAGGDRMRVKVSNAFGTVPVELAHVTVGVQRLKGSAALAPGTLRDVTFGGARSVTLAAGEERYSDGIELPVGAGTDVLVSTFTPKPSGPVTYHAAAMTSSFYATDGTDHASDLEASGLPNVTGSWHYVTEVDTQPGDGARAVVAMGDSITDGIGSTSGEDRRWPDLLAERYRAQPGQLGRVGVLNAGISGNRVLLDGAGARATARLDRDVLQRSGARTLVVLEGINDIQQTPHQLDPSKITAGLEELAVRARAAGLRVIGGTVTPFKGWSTYDADEEAARQGVNDWIRHSGAFDAVLDFDATLRDPEDPHRMLPAYDSGDHLHPSDAGYRAMAAAVDLRTLVPPTDVPAGADPAPGRSLTVAALPDTAVVVAGRTSTIPVRARVVVRGAGTVKGTMTVGIAGQDTTRSWSVASDGRFTQVDLAQDLRVPAGTSAGTHDAQVTVTTADGQRTSATIRVDVLRVGCATIDDACTIDVRGAYDLDGIASPTDPGGTGFDGLGWSYAADTMPGAGIDVLGGTPFDFPSSADGVRNVVRSSSETLPLPALTGRTLRLLASATGGGLRSSATVTYTDGTSASVPLGASDWAGGAAAGEDVAVAAPHRFRNPSGTDGPPVSIYVETVALDPTKVLRSMTLPDDGRLKVFALTVLQAH